MGEELDYIETFVQRRRGIAHVFAASARRRWTLTWLRQDRSVVVVTLDMAPVKQERVPEHHLVAYDAAQRGQVFLRQAYFTGEAAAEIADRPVAAPNQPVFTERGHQNVEVRLVGGEIGGSAP